MPFLWGKKEMVLLGVCKMKIEINGVPKEKAEERIHKCIEELKSYFESFKYIYEESKGK